MFGWWFNLWRVALSTREEMLAAENQHLRHELAEAREQIEKEQSRNRILALEQEILLAAIERDRLRVQAEATTYAARVVTEERGPS